MREIKVQDAVGCVLCHDVTKIVRGEIKDAAFRKGHVITAEDIPELLKLGKENIFVWENDDTKLHENDAAEILRAICQGENLSAGSVKEGKIELKAACDGVFHVDAEKLNAINDVDEICIATVPNKIPVRKNKSVAGMRVIPLVINKEKMERVKKIAGDVPLMKIAPYKKFKVGLVVTGSEIFHERIQDTFTPVIEAKLKTFGLQVDERRISDDSKEMTREKISELLNLGMEMILCTGGMSVDPDDRTPAAIKSTGADVVTYGVPVLPGAMFMLAYKGDVPIMGLPGCVMFCSKTVFDMILPRVLTGEKLTRRDFTTLGVGGLL
ncbi:MAG: molybdopterin-binding protein [Selenomonadaceae bacterium]|nr:molybdopterin-binding protein [Selenomonadaceae bacterium]MBQ7493540.1 molybdopterin-binding protein [Selenomonadaceae bacterium]